MSDKDVDMANAPGLGWRTSVTIFVSLGWLAFVILWLVFLSAGWTLYQSIAIVLVSLLIFVAVVCLMWVPWGLKYGREHKKEK